MEGTRHERVLTVLSAYLIGFTTAFIAFGVTQIEDSVNFVYVPVPTQTAAVVDAVEEPAPAPVASDLVAYLTEDGLVYAKDGAETLVSAYAEDADMDGVHHSIFEFGLSPDENFLYFCEVPTSEAEACKPFVYSAAADAVYPVTEAGDRIALPLSATELSWGTDGLAAISGLTVDASPIR